MAQHVLHSVTVAALLAFRLTGSCSQMQSSAQIQQGKHSIFGMTVGQAAARAWPCCVYRAAAPTIAFSEHHCCTCCTDGASTIHVCTHSHHAQQQLAPGSAMHTGWVHAQCMGACQSACNHYPVCCASVPHNPQRQPDTCNDWHSCFTNIKP